MGTTRICCTDCLPFFPSHHRTVLTQGDGTDKECCKNPEGASACCAAGQSCCGTGCCNAGQACCSGQCCADTCMFGRYCVHTLGMSERTTLIVGGVVVGVVVVAIVAAIVCCCTSDRCCTCCTCCGRADRAGPDDDSADDARPARRGAAAGVPLAEVTTDPAPAPAPAAGFLTTSISSAALRADDAARMELVNCLELARAAATTVLQKLREEMLGPNDAAMLLAAATSGSVLKFKNASPAAFVCPPATTTLTHARTRAHSHDRNRTWSAPRRSL